jgi:hypothetical protein
MADISVTPKQGGSRTWLFALLAIVCTAGLMIWLAMQEGTTSPTPVVEEDTTAAAVADSLPADTTVADTTVADTTP